MSSKAGYFIKLQKKPTEKAKVIFYENSQWGDYSKFRRGPNFTEHSYINVVYTSRFD